MMRFLQRLFGSWGRDATSRRPESVPRRRPRVECLEDRNLLDASPLLLQTAPEGSEAVRLQLPALVEFPALRSGAVGATLRNAWFSPTASGRLTAAFLLGAGGPAAAGPGRLVVLTDFNGDGLPDLAINAGDRISVAVGQTDGTFRVSFTLLGSANPGEPGSLITGDFDRDGTADVLAVSRGGKTDGKVSLLFGAGDGTFRLALDFWLSSPGGADARLRGLVDPTRISVASWSPQSRGTLESLGLLPPAPPAPTTSTAGRDAVRPTVPTKDRDSVPEVEPKQDTSDNLDPKSTSTGHAVRAVADRETAEQAPAAPPESRPAAAAPHVQQPTAAPEVLDPAAIALVHLSGADADPLPEAHAVAVAARLPPVEPTVEAGVSPPALAAELAPNPAPEVAAPRVEAPREPVTLWAPWAATLATGLAAEAGFSAGVFAAAATPLVGDSLSPPNVASHAGPETPTGAERRRTFSTWQEWGQVVFPLLYLGTVGRITGPAAPAAPLQTPSDSQMQLADLIRRSTETFTRVVQQFYQTFLGRAAVGDEEQGWVGMLLAGQTQEQVLAAFLGTAEFRDRAVSLAEQGTPDERFLHGLHGLLLGRPATDAEMEGYLAGLPALGREGVAALLLRSHDYRALQIDACLSELTGQPASAADVAAWADSPFDLLTVRAFLHQSAETRAVS
jgi:hypothetical protein